MRRITLSCGLAVLAVAAAPHTATAQFDAHLPQASLAAAGGTVFGGVSAQRLPVVLETSRAGRRISRAVVALSLTCTSGDAFVAPDGYLGLRVDRRRRFGASFGPLTETEPDGSSIELSGSMRGAFNRARSKATGRWSLTARQRDAAGAVTDTCESGNVRWTARQ